MKLDKKALERLIQALRDDGRAESLILAANAKARLEGRDGITKD